MTSNSTEQHREDMAEHLASLTAGADSRSTLAQLVDLYAEAKDAEAAAADRVKDLRDQLLEAQADLGGQPELAGTRSVIRVSTTSGWRLDSTRLKAEQPAIYAAFGKQTSSTRLTVTPRQVQA